jgi:hypothetical protein
MMNEPTMRAMTANTSRNVLKKDTNSPMASWVSLVISSPVRTSTASGTTATMASRTSTWLTPSWARTEMESSFPGSAMSCWAAGSVNITLVVPPALSLSPKAAMPTMVTSTAPA